MGFLVTVDASGDVLEAHGNTAQDAGRLFGLSGVGPGGLDGLVNAYRENHAGFSRSWIGQYSATVVEDQLLVLVQSSLGLGRAFYAQAKDRLVVGTELAAVAQRVGCKELDPVFFARFMAMRPVLDRTPYAKVRRLYGGETIIFGDKGKHSSRPWQPTNQEFKGNALDRLHCLLNEAIDLYAAVDRTTIIDLSGGTDSSLVAAIASDMGRKIQAISYIPEKGAVGNDRHFAKLVANRLGVPLTEIGLDQDSLTTTLPDLPDQPGGCSYRDMIRSIGDHFRLHDAPRHLTGVGGDIVFDFGGLAPAFLADPLVKGRFVAAWRQAAAYAQERGGHRSATHYIRYVALPIAARHLRGQNTGAQPNLTPADWLAASLLRQAGSERAPLAHAVTHPSSRFLWELIFDMTAAENLAQPWSPTTETIHPLLHRPLVEFCLSLAPNVRRGIGGDRALQRELLRQLGLQDVAERTDKGSTQPSRETDLQNEPAFLESLINGELAMRGWIEPTAWRRAIDQIRLGVSPNSTHFAAAIECELWLRRAVADGNISAAVRHPPRARFS